MSDHPDLERALEALARYECYAFESLHNHPQPDADMRQATGGEYVKLEDARALLRDRAAPKWVCQCGYECSTEAEAKTHLPESREGHRFVSAPPSLVRIKMLSDEEHAVPVPVDGLRESVARSVMGYRDDMDECLHVADRIIAEVRRAAPVSVGGLLPCGHCGSPARVGSEHEIIVEGHDIPGKCIVDQIMFHCTPERWNRRAAPASTDALLLEAYKALAWSYWPEDAIGDQIERIYNEIAKVLTKETAAFRAENDSALRRSKV